MKILGPKKKYKRYGLFNSKYTLKQVNLKKYLTIYVRVHKLLLLVQPKMSYDVIKEYPPNVSA